MRAVFQRVKWASVAIPAPPPNNSPPPPSTPLPNQLPPQPTPPTDNLPIQAHSPTKEIVTIDTQQQHVQVIGTIGHGLVVLLGVGKEDSQADVSYLVDRTLNLRIFSDPSNNMNLSLVDVHGEVLVVSQFTLFGDTRKGRRPSFFDAMEPTHANGLYLSYCEQLKANGITVATGQFGEHMHVELLNDGPVTILVDSKKTF